MDGLMCILCNRVSRAEASGIREMHSVVQSSVELSCRGDAFGSPGT